jgi:capsular exopolysaccharide synthesis family protein
LIGGSFTVTVQKPEVTTLADYLAVLRRRWWVVVLVALLVPLAAYAYTTKQQKMYTASVKMLVSNQVLSPAGSGQQVTKQDPVRDLSTLAQVAEVPSVARDTLSSVSASGLTPTQLLKETAVTADSTANILTFQVTDKNPSRAVNLANTYASKFIGYRQGINNALINAAIAQLNVKIKALRGELNGVKPSQLSDIRQQIGTFLSQRGNLQNQQILQAHSLAVVSKAQSAPQTKPNVAKSVAIGLALGLVLGLAAAFLLSSLDSRVRVADDVSAMLGLTLLARIPSPPADLRKRDELAMLSREHDGASEPYRKLKTNIDFANLAVNARTILVTSAVEREGKSTTVANLAVAFAKSGRRVVLVDLDLRRPYLDKFFGLGGRAGVTDAALGRVPLDEAVARIPLSTSLPRAHSNGNGSGMGSLEVMTAGSGLADPAEFMSTSELAHLLNCLAERSDIVLIDSSPLLPVTDAMVLSSHVDAVALVVRSGDVKKPVLAELSRVIDRIPTPKLGFALTNAEADSTYGYGSYYGSYTSGTQEQRQESVPATARD